MYFFHLRKKLRRVVLGQEKMVDGCCNLDSQPLSKFLVLDAEILDSLLVLDFLEEFREAIAFYNLTTEPREI